MIVHELRREFKLSKLLRLANLARSTYYYNINNKKTDKYSTQKERIKEIYEANFGRYGYRRIMFALRAEGIVLNHKTVHKLMKEMSLAGKRKRSEYNSYKGDVGHVVSNLINGNFYAEKPFEKLATDITAFNVCNRKVYLSSTIDLYNMEIVAYSVSLRPSIDQVRRMLRSLVEKLPKDSRPIFHSDQGWQYQHAHYQSFLKEHNIIQSMSKKGSCKDNGAMESFFGRLKVEMFYGEKFNTVDDFISKLHKYIDYYNNRRIALRLEGMSPVEYRIHSL